MRRGGLVALGGSVLPGHPAGEPFTHPHHGDEVVHGRPPACRAQKFPEAISFNAAFSSSASASSRFSVAFSRSRSFSRLGVVGLQPAELVPPPVVGLLRYAQLAADVGDVLALGQQPIGLGELADHLLRVCAVSSSSS